MLIEFTKMQGLGNDFVVIDAIRQDIHFNENILRFIADRHFGIGCDQILLVEHAHHSTADFRYRIFNADGSEVAQCGNGARCFARFIRDKRLSYKDHILVDTHAGQLLLNFDNESDLITVNMGIPHHHPSLIPVRSEEEQQFYMVNVDGVEKAFGAVSIGNPHVVLEVNDIHLAAVESLGFALERHPFFPERVNVGFMQIINRQNIKLRVYERGSGETLACGSGACAAVIIGIEHKLLDADVTVKLANGNLTIHWAGRGTPVFMTGSAVSVFEGQIEI